MTELSGRTVQYGYDDLYRLTSETIAGATSQNGTIGYTYDPVGNRQQITSTVNAIPSSGLLNYDANDRTATDTYDNNGNTVAQAGIANVYDFENHLVQHRYSYDALNRLTNLAVAIPSYTDNYGQVHTAATLNNYAYTLGAAGNRTQVTELSGRTVHYGYDDLYRLTSETIAGATSQNGTIGYSYDAVGNRQQITSTVNAIPSSGLLNYDANDRTATDTCDNNGNTVAQAGIANV